MSGGDMKQKIQYTLVEKVKIKVGFQYQNKNTKQPYPHSKQNGKGVIALVVRWCTNHASGHWFDSWRGVI